MVALTLRMRAENGQEALLIYDQNLTPAEMENEIRKANGFASMDNVVLKLPSEDSSVDMNISAKSLHALCLECIENPDKKPFGERDLTQGLLIKVVQSRPTVPASAPASAPAPTTIKAKATRPKERHHNEVLSATRELVRAGWPRRPAETVEKTVDGKAKPFPVRLQKLLLQEKDVKADGGYAYMGGMMELKRDVFFNKLKLRFPDLEASSFKVIVNKHVNDENVALKKYDEAKETVRALELATNGDGAPPEIADRFASAAKELKKRRAAPSVAAWKDFRGPKSSDGVRLHSDRYTAQLRMELTEEERKIMVASSSSSAPRASKSGSLVFSGHALSNSGILANLFARRQSSASQPSFAGDGANAAGPASGAASGAATGAASGAASGAADASGARGGAGASAAGGSTAGGSAAGGNAAGGGGAAGNADNISMPAEVDERAAMMKAAQALENERKEKQKEKQKEATRRRRAKAEEDKKKAKNNKKTCKGKGKGKGAGKDSNKRKKAEESEDEDEDPKPGQRKRSAARKDRGAADGKKRLKVEDESEEEDGEATSSDSSAEGSDDDDDE